MRYLYDICLRDIKKKSKYSHLKCRSQKEFEKYKHIILSLKNIELKDVDEILYLYMKDHNKLFNQHLLRRQFNIVFNNNQDCNYLMTDMINNATNKSRSNYLRETIDRLKEDGYDFSHFAEMDIITLAHRRDMTYDFYLKHNMPAFECKLNAMINKDKNLINKFPQDWRQPLNIRFECYRV